MQVPAVMFIEIAIDSMQQRGPEANNAAIKEFRCLGVHRMNRARAIISTTEDGTSGPGDLDLVTGYLMGLETARAIAEMSRGGETS